MAQSLSTRAKEDVVVVARPYSLFSTARIFLTFGYKNARSKHKFNEELKVIIHCPRKLDFVEKEADKI